jgi:HD-GYP domain-containing protein (c-di-GMP phosphodiesterase class II)
VLNAPRKLTLVEFEVIKMHTVYTYDLLSDFPESVRLGASCHHEKLNGQGYPYRLVATGVPLEARITAVSDIYDAIVSQRSYKAARSPFSVIAIIKSLAGTELDPKLVDIFLKNMPQELIGRQVLLSSGTVGIVKAIDDEDMEHPYIQIEDEIIKTDETCFVKSMF